MYGARILDAVCSMEKRPVQNSIEENEVLTRSNIGDCYILQAAFLIRHVTHYSVYGAQICLENKLCFDVYRGPYADK